MQLTQEGKMRESRDQEEATYGAAFKGKEIVLAALWGTSYGRVRVEVERPGL